VPPRARSHGSSAERQRRERSLLFPLTCLVLFVGVVKRVCNMLSSLTCSWKCCSQGGYASRPHPHAVRGAAAAAPQVLGLLPVRESSNACVRSFMFFSWLSDPDVLVFWVVSGALASRYHKLLEGRLVSVLHSLVNFVHGHFRLQHPVSAYLCAYAFGARCFGHVCACTLLHMCIIVLSV
jgi:hypothetical protein